MAKRALTDRRRLWWAAAILAVALVAAACGGGSDGGAGDGLDGNNATEDAGSEDGDDTIFMYTGEELVGGEEVTLTEVLALGKPVVLNYWAGLCPPCRQEMPDFQAAQDERPDDFLMLGVDVGRFTRLGSQQDALNLLDDLGITYATGYVESDRLLREYEIFEMPSTVFLTPDGEVADKVGGFMTGDQIRQEVSELIEASTG